MQVNTTITQLLKRLWIHINRRRRSQFIFLLVLMLLASFAEILSIGAVLPFLGVLTAPERIFRFPPMQSTFQALGLIEPTQLLLPLTIFFGIAVLISGATRMILLWATTRFSFSVGSELSNIIYRRTLYQPYIVHVARNSSEVISGISVKVHNVIYTILIPILTIISSVVMLVIILIGLFFVDPFIAICAFGGFGLIYLIIIRMAKKRLSVNGLRIAHESTQVIKALQEGLGGIRDVLIDGSQATYCQIYHNADISLRRAQGNTQFISQSPRFIMEALGMLLIAILAYLLAKQPDGIAKAIPILGALALGAQRLLPVLQQTYGALTAMQAGQASLHDAIDLLEQPLPEYADKKVEESLIFKDNITLKKIGFRYSPQMPYILKNVNLKITKGSRIGFIGITGSGKSTLLDIVMGLLNPTDGVIEVDGRPVLTDNTRGWQAHLAHVPQAVFLADSTIEQNIAFGVPMDQIDSQRVRVAAQQAQIADSIESWPKQYKTLVGERGICLSGGQRQRIGIARALYKKADVIIFDEATSALDSETEQAVMQAIDGLSEELTLLIIAHRITTLKSCTQIVEMGHGGIIRVGNYEEIVN
jgi:ABC-type bacteriocin/lantibiotic exporter with double-glycine peptidase domain